LSKKLVLDIGCGTYCRGDVGVDIQFWYKNPCDHPEKFDGLLGSKNPNCMYVGADLNYPLPFRDEVFDVVVARAVLEHLLRPYDCLLELRRVMKKGGRLLIIVPNARVSEADWRDDTHYYSFTPPTARRLVSKVFKVKTLKLLFGGETIFVEAIKE